MCNHSHCPSSYLLWQPLLASYIPTPLVTCLSPRMRALVCYPTEHESFGDAPTSTKRTNRTRNLNAVAMSVAPALERTLVSLPKVEKEVFITNLKKKESTLPVDQKLYLKVEHFKENSYQRKMLHEKIRYITSTYYPPIPLAIEYNMCPRIGFFVSL